MILLSRGKERPLLQVKSDQSPLRKFFKGLKVRAEPSFKSIIQFCWVKDVTLEEKRKEQKKRSQFLEKSNFLDFGPQD